MKIDAIKYDDRAGLLFTAESQADWMELERIVNEIYDADVDIAEYLSAVQLLPIKRQLKIKIYYYNAKEIMSC